MFTQVLENSVYITLPPLRANQIARITSDFKMDDK